MLLRNVRRSAESIPRLQRHQRHRGNLRLPAETAEPCPAPPPVPASSTAPQRHGGDARALRQSCSLAGCSMGSGEILNPNT